MKKEIDPKKLTQNNEEEVQVIKAESKGRKILNTVINVLLVIDIVLAAVFNYV